ncbi:MAG: hypothetical protein QOG54_2189 [Actinomycetota bacterium]|jgi:hypothetical protein|nr:hypothetical protein [Actinomycetota bacterium]
MQGRIKKFAAVLGMTVALGSIVAAPAASAATAPKIAYIGNTDQAWAGSFFNVARQAGYQVTALQLSRVASSSFSSYDLVVVGDDTASDCWAGWGTDAAVTAIENSGTPVLGIGQGGSCFFDQTAPALGWMNSMYTSSDSANLENGGVTKLFNTASSALAAYNPAPENITCTADMVGDSLYHMVLDQTTAGHHDTLWGFRSNPNNMTAAGKALFLNTISKALVG